MRVKFTTIQKMADPNEKNPLNSPGAFYNDLSCIDCGMCPDIAPMIFRRDDLEGNVFAWRQPANEEEERLAREALESCPTESIGDDGE